MSKNNKSNNDNEYEEEENQSFLGLGFFTRNFEKYDKFGPDNPRASAFYRGLLGIESSDTAKYICYGPKIISKRLFTWDIKYYDDAKRTYLMQGSRKNFSKFLYCIFFKFLTFPIFQILLILVRYTIVFLLMFGNLIWGLGVAIVNLGIYIINLVFIHKSNPFSGNGAPIGYYSLKIKLKGQDNYEEYYPNPIMLLIGFCTPIFKIFDKNDEYKQKYGSGEFFFLVCAIMLVSAILIFIGGSSITVAIIGFAMYCFKLISALTNFSGGVAGEAQKNVKTETSK